MYIALILYRRIIYAKDSQSLETVVEILSAKTLIYY